MRRKKVRPVPTAFDERRGSKANVKSLETYFNADWIIQIKLQVNVFVSYVFRSILMSLMQEN